MFCAGFELLIRETGYRVNMLLARHAFRLGWCATPSGLFQLFISEPFDGINVAWVFGHRCRKKE